MEPERVATSSPGRPRGRGPAAAAAAATRPWLVVSKPGGSSVEELGRHAVMMRTGLLARDLRSLDPSAGNPAAFLVRERAIVVRLEHVRAIITAVGVMVPNPGDPLVQPLIKDLVRRGDSPPGASPCIQDPLKEENHEALPFEFRALELCLENVLRHFESETSSLEEEMHVAVDALTSKISTSNIERVRNIKSRLIAILAHAHKMRNELENLLDNDSEMSQMCLTDSLVSQQMKKVPSDNELDCDSVEAYDEIWDEASKSKTQSAHLTCNHKPEVQNLEILLDAYFVQIQGTLHKLSALRDDISDTIDYINITLDDKQNQVLHLGVILSTAIFILNIVILMTCIFQINLRIELYNKGFTQFWEIAIGLTACGVFLHFVAIGWFKKIGILA